MFKKPPPAPKKPIPPEQEFIVTFKDEIPKDAGEKTLKTIFNQHAKGEICEALSTRRGIFLIKDIDWEILEELKTSPKVAAIGPNRKYRL